jgi:pimeloyl-ACP methyl ester carboxylesterase
MPTLSSSTLRIQPYGRDVVSASIFGNESANSGAIIMNYGFPGDSRNYDIACRLAELGYVLYIPHPRGIEGSDGMFTFRDASECFIAVLEYCKENQHVVGVVSYCYSALWVLQALVDRSYVVKVLSLAPILDWSTARLRINELSEGGFQGFLEQSLHGKRQGFYGVRCEPEHLMSEYMELEGSINLRNIVAEPYRAPITTLFGESDLIVDQGEIYSSHDYLRALGMDSEVICIPGTGHFFTMRRRLLFEQFKVWAR